ncbi:MAG: hypothetical protein ACKPKO_57995, partial [Candidatus Fonsibacter sp.]
GLDMLFHELCQQTIQFLVMHANITELIAYFAQLGCPPATMTASQIMKQVKLTTSQIIKQC